MVTMSVPRITLKITKDGSHTLHTSQFDADYHSIHGSRQEALHVYIEHGLKATKASPIRVLEVGFGSGLNMLLSILQTQDTTLYYTSIEPFPIDPELIHHLNFPQNESEKRLFFEIHSAEWNTPHRLNTHITIEKIKTTLQTFETQNKFDIVYYDAFGPNAQPELWTEPIFTKVFSLMEDEGRLVTFCAQGQMKRNLKAAGFRVYAVPGPPGKREMTLAIKPSTL